MKLIHKSIILISVVTCMGIFQACDFLDEKLPNQFDTENYYRNDEEAVKALYGTYASVKDLVFGNDFVSITDAMCDDMDFKGTDQARRALSSLEFDTRNKYFVNVWAKLYNIINNANLLIENVPDMETLTPNSEIAQRMIIAEAKFIRAWAYFTLVQLWGEVPKITEPTTSIRDNIRPARASVEDIYSLILDDLDDAEILGDTPYTVTKGTDISFKLAITKGAVRLVKAKVYLCMKDYGNCLEAVQYLIDRFDESGSKLYTLADYTKLFDVTQKNDPERKKEIIWEIEALAVSGYNNTAHREFAPSGQINSSNTTGYQNYVPSTSLFEAFSKQISDIRYTSNYRVGTLKQPCILKRIDTETTDQTMGAPNIVLLRVADAVLVYAEALNKEGRTTEAIEWINKIRKRAGLITELGPITIGDIKPDTPAEVVNDTILFERRLEFAHEGQRLFDLRRTGKLMEALNAYNSAKNRYSLEVNHNFPATKEITETNATAITLTVPFTEITKNNSERFLLHPVPADEILSNPNLNPNNPGYN